MWQSAKKPYWEFLEAFPAGYPPGIPEGPLRVISVEIPSVNA